MSTPGGARNLGTDSRPVNREILENDKGTGWRGKWPEERYVTAGSADGLSGGVIFGGLGHAQEGGLVKMGADDLQTHGELQ